MEILVSFKVTVQHNVFTALTSNAVKNIDVRQLILHLLAERGQGCHL
jgi:hypothetical protein